jgi:hypothetical protein
LAGPVFGIRLDTTTLDANQPGWQQRCRCVKDVVRCGLIIHNRKPPRSPGWRRIVSGETACVGRKRPVTLGKKSVATIRWAYGGLFYVLVMARLRLGYVSTYQHDSPRRPRVNSRAAGFARSPSPADSSTVMGLTHRLQPADTHPIQATAPDKARCSRAERVLRRPRRRDGET